MRTRRGASIAWLMALLACAGTEAPPTDVDTRNDVCRFCRMPVSNSRIAAQLAAPGEETEFFDDIGCLRGFLERNGTLGKQTVAYVADHSTGAWGRASSAVFSRCPALETPMGSHLVAHVDAASRDHDAATRDCARISVQEIFGPQGPPDGVRR